LQKTTLHELIAGLVTVIALGGIVALRVLSKDTPPELAAIVGASTTWLYMNATVQNGNEHADLILKAIQEKKEL